MLKYWHDKDQDTGIRTVIIDICSMYYILWIKSSIHCLWFWHIQFCLEFLNYFIIKNAQFLGQAFYKHHVVSAKGKK